MLGWTQGDLARASGVSALAIKKLERGLTDPRASTLNAIQRAFDDAGVLFLDVGDIRDGGPGVRLKRPLARGIKKSPSPETMGPSAAGSREAVGSELSSRSPEGWGLAAHRVERGYYTHARAKRDPATPLPRSPPGLLAWAPGGAAFMVIN